MFRVNLKFDHALLKLCQTEVDLVVKIVLPEVC